MLTPRNPKQRQNVTRQKYRRKSGKFRINFQDGRFDLGSANAWHTYWREPYYLLLKIPWLGFLFLMVAFYLIINAIFACAYLLGGDCIANAASGSFADAFFFSVQTITSIGYGSMYPTTTYANILVTIEAFVGTVITALVTGLAFAKFTQPTAKVVFSKVAAISSYNGVPTLMLRAANQRRNQILEAEVRLYLMRDEISLEGQYMRRFYLLKLLRDRTPRFTLSWTLMHQVNEDSPLWGATPESLVKTRSMLVASLNGIDETVSQWLHAPHSYDASDIVWGYRFADIIQQTSENHFYIDFARFHDLEAVEINQSD
ncbi:MAG: ion channel [Cyanobacteria bacterium J06635_13]